MFSPGPAGPDGRAGRFGKQVAQALMPQPVARLADGIASTVEEGPDDHVQKAAGGSGRHTGVGRQLGSGQ